MRDIKMNKHKELYRQSHHNGKYKCIATVTNRNKQTQKKPCEKRKTPFFKKSTKKKQKKNERKIRDCNLFMHLILLVHINKTISLGITTTIFYKIYINYAHFTTSASIHSSAIFFGSLCVRVCVAYVVCAVYEVHTCTHIIHSFSFQQCFALLSFPYIFFASLFRSYHPLCIHSYT